MQIYFFRANLAFHVSQSAGTVEYANYFSAEAKEPPTTDDDCPGYNTKQSDS